MGWLKFDGHAEEHSHEGFVVMVVKAVDGWVWRELGYSFDDTVIPPDHEVRVQVGCACGWRSQRLVVPANAEWIPFCVVLDEAVEDAFHDVWLAEHRLRLPDYVSGSWRRVADKARAALAVGS